MYHRNQDRRPGPQSHFVSQNSPAPDPSSKQTGPRNLEHLYHRERKIGLISWESFTCYGFLASIHRASGSSFHSGINIDDCSGAILITDVWHQFARERANQGMAKGRGNRAAIQGCGALLQGQGPGAGTRSIVDKQPPVVEASSVHLNNPISLQLKGQTYLEILVKLNKWLLFCTRSTHRIWLLILLFKF